MKIFLTLSPTIKSFNQTEIIAKYPEEIANKLITNAENINNLINANNSNFAIKIEHYHYLTKDEGKASSIVKIDNESEDVVKIIKEQQNPNNTHNFSANKLIIEINKLLKKNNIELKYKGEIKKFNMTHFILMCKYYGIKNNPQLCFEYGIHQQPSYSYSYKAIEFVFNELKKDPEHIIENIINKNKKS